MMYTGRLLGKEYGEFLEILPPLSFKCFVRGKEITATVAGKLFGVDFFYRIKFSDGYVSDFAPSVSGRWCDMTNEPEYREQDKHPYSTYADAIQEDLSDMHLFDLNKERYCFRLKIQGKETNVFVYSNEEDGRYCYSVRYNGGYRFSLKKVNGGWEAWSMRKTNPEKIDAELARNISLSIEAEQ